MRETILIADPDAASRLILRSRLSEAHYQPLMACDGSACLQLAVSARPALIVIDARLGGLPNATALLHQLRSEALTAGLPLLLLCEPQDQAARLAGLEAGADDVIPRSPDLSVLLARIRNLLRRGQPTSLLAEAWGLEQPALSGFAEQLAGFQHMSSIGGSIGVIAASSETAHAWRHHIPAGLRLQAHVQTPGNGAGPPRLHDVYLICAARDDSGEEPGSGFRLMSQLASGQASRDSLCALILAQPDATVVALAYDLGADDVLAADISGAELALRLTNMLRRKAQRDGDQQRIREGLKLALIDPLTGAWNRRYAMPRLTSLCSEARRTGQPLAVLVLDIDRFKQVNDIHGHAAGDLVLTEVVQRLSATLRAGDLLARIGGEEFLIALPGTGAREASSVAERLRRLISDRPFELGEEGPDRAPGRLDLTISMGLRISTGQDDALVLTEAADGALRESKRAGRNLVTLCQSHG
ncbi:diguanylate cyclase domain-containing protein [Pseudogemmobacter faecipullorum]|uniref:diguanylate cyclase n=1 Tax=Pseudogemmobacter faecipullorum TaxID=2755041 RepID=A0ABS8CKF3_9RHOB|nr:diguanylate cyclase [Pseudogemmobacter faecipullorum]MCB5409861.1 diguanylate cyclase [Pseudogemmobacter faecipullorum]